MDEWLESPWVRQPLEKAQEWLDANVLSTYPFVQLVAVAGLAVLAWALSLKLKSFLRTLEPRRSLAWLRDFLVANAFPVTLVAFLGAAMLLSLRMLWPFHIIEIAASLVTAWLVINAVSKVFRDSIWSRRLAWLIWIIAALNIVGLLGPVVSLLDSVAISLGGFRVSPYTVIKATVALAVLLSSAFYAARLSESRIHATEGLSPSLKVLISKSLKIVLVGLALLIAVRSLGIDLGALAIFGGAVALGVGFGLQKIISNLISGLILLVDKSIKPGDVIALGDTYGWVNSLGGRYVSVITRDGVEHLIPNETLITERVENWTYSNTRTRLRVQVGIHYDSDVRKAMALCMEAAEETDRVIKNPAPNCLLRGFGDSSVDLELRFWIMDPQNGVANVKSAVMLRIWDEFHEHGIEIPYPQRDLHLKTPGIAPDSLQPSPDPA